MSEYIGIIGTPIGILNKKNLENKLLSTFHQLYSQDYPQLPKKMVLSYVFQEWIYKLQTELDWGLYSLPWNPMGINIEATNLSKSPGDSNRDQPDLPKRWEVTSNSLILQILTLILWRWKKTEETSDTLGCRRWFPGHLIHLASPKKGHEKNSQKLPRLEITSFPNESFERKTRLVTSMAGYQTPTAEKFPKVPLTCENFIQLCDWDSVYCVYGSWSWSKWMIWRGWWMMIRNDETMMYQMF